ncbi:Trichome birefringence-like, N-terminal domain [Dillenia turbinata]|uniref:Trichome birefringence-like, N-terminal domain n=1 Tax=Dillenia turbinata TaxID=194707 RepID=A0AAN8W7D1_9MAGN
MEKNLGIKSQTYYPFTAFLVSAIILVIFYLKKGENSLSAEDSTTKHGNSSERCNYYSGKWVFDNKAYPLYKGSQCPIMTEDFACEKFGRKDLMYQNWRWQPHHCDLPRFNGRRLLESLRNKRVVFVGDSLGRNQWMSMVCMLVSTIPSLDNSLQLQRIIYRFQATEYNATIDFYWSPFLVESNCDDAWEHRGLENRVVRFQAIEKHATHWADADILIFDSYIWWRDSQIKFLWGSFDDQNGIYKEVSMPHSFEQGLQTWSDWLELHINRHRTRLFFVTMSPTHSWAEEWGRSADQNCYGETQQIRKEGYQGRGSDPRAMQVLEAAIDKLKKRGLTVQILNITQLSEYRREAHPSIYRKYWQSLTEYQLSHPSNYSDCAHWCLPGVPDTWNELLYAHLFHD